MAEAVAFIDCPICSERIPSTATLDRETLQISLDSTDLFAHVWKHLEDE